MNTTTQRVLLGVAFTAAGFAAWAGMELADDAHAWAADRKPGAVVEHAGGVLDHQLPEQASDRAKQVHDQVAPEPHRPAVKPKPKPKPPVCEEPAEQPKPPKAEPKPPPSEEPAEEPADDEPRKDPPGGEHGPDEVPPPVVVETPPIVVTLPATDPAPLPDAEAPATTPLPAPPPAAVLPGSLPVLIGPIPAEQPPAGIVAQLVTSLTAAEPNQPADCADDPDDARHINRDALRALLGIVDKQPTAAAGHDRPAKPCPGHPVDPHADCASSIATNSGHAGANSANADLADSTVAPVLARLQHARPRSTIPAGRHTAIEPGPA